MFIAPVGCESQTAASVEQKITSARHKMNPLLTIRDQTPSKIAAARADPVPELSRWIDWQTDMDRMDIDCIRLRENQELRQPRHGYR
jgi:hypothetical protein